LIPRSMCSWMPKPAAQHSTAQHDGPRQHPARNVCSLAAHKRRVAVVPLGRAAVTTRACNVMFTTPTLLKANYPFPTHGAAAAVLVRRSAAGGLPCIAQRRAATRTALPSARCCASSAGMLHAVLLYWYCRMQADTKLLSCALLPDQHTGTLHVDANTCCAAVPAQDTTGCWTCCLLLSCRRGRLAPAGPLQFRAGTATAAAAVRQLSEADVLLACCLRAACVLLSACRHSAPLLPVLTPLPQIHPTTTARWLLLTEVARV
jgi:hypothetical protein